VTVRVVTDSTADLPPEVAQELDVTVVPLLLVFGDQVYRDGLGPALGVYGGPGIISMVVIEAEKADGDPGSANGGTD
jgi:fatty acid-binding protein DegV